jgi:poly-beta-1,6-N-acetyl-D-glucosamine synthase
MPVFIFIFLILLLAWFFLIEFYRVSWKKIPVHTEDHSSQVPVSVVIAARNEAHNLPDLFKALSAQDYPLHLMEVIIVDDHSTDHTYEIIAKSPFTALQLLPGSEGKKKAIETAVHMATGKLIITTDADCLPPSSWISSLTSFYTSTGAKFIAAPVRMTGKNTIRDIFQQIDFLTMQGITGASVSRRVHMMCNGANLAYEKAAFLEVNGFNGIDEIPSGDDMLLMEKIFRHHPNHVYYLKDTDAIVDTPAEPTWKMFFHQRIRWASKATRYQDKKIVYALLLTYLVNVCFIVMTAAAIADRQWLPFLLLMLGMKILIEFPFVNAVAIFFNRQRLLTVFPFLQPLHIVYVVVAGWLGTFGSYQWKSRVVKNKGRTNLAKQ